MLTRAATSVALKLLGQPKSKQNLYFACTYFIIAIPIALSGLTGHAVIVATTGLLAYIAWRHWFKLVRTAMAHFSEQTAKGTP